MTADSIFETRECSRCGGCGRYSWNQRHGDICYGCGGGGVALTTAGAAAKEAWIAAYTVTVKVQDVKPGMKVMVKDSMRGREIIRTVTASEADSLNVGQNRWNLRFEVKNPNSSELGGVGFFIDSEVRLPASAEDKKTAYESIAHMPGALGWPVAA